MVALTRMNRILIALPLLLAACVTRSRMRSLPSDAGLQGIHKAEFEKVRQASRDALGELEFGIKEDHDLDESTWHILATQGLGSGTMGRLVRIRIEKGEEEVSVRVAIRSKTDTSAASATDQAIARDILEKITKRLQ